MIQLTEQQFETLKRRENPEVLSEEQISNWILDAAEKLQKADLGEADAIEKAEVEEFNNEFKSFTKIQVISSPKEGELNKGLRYDNFYIRERQVEWSEEIQKGEDGEPLLDDNNEIIKARSGVYTDTAENRKLGRVGQKFGSKRQSEGIDSKNASKVHFEQFEAETKGKYKDLPKSEYNKKFNDWASKKKTTSSIDEGEGKQKIDKDTGYAEGSGMDKFMKERKGSGDKGKSDGGEKKFSIEEIKRLSNAREDGELNTMEGELVEKLNNNKHLSQKELSVLRTALDDL